MWITSLKIIYIFENMDSKKFCLSPQQETYHSAFTTKAQWLRGNFKEATKECQVVVCTIPAWKWD